MISDKECKEYDMDIVCEVHQLNIHYGTRSGSLWHYEFENGRHILYCFPFLDIKKVKSCFGKWEKDLREKGLGIGDCIPVMEFKSREEILLYIKGVKDGIDLMIDNMLGKNEKLKMLID